LGRLLDASLLGAFSQIGTITQLHPRPLRPRRIHDDHREECPLPLSKPAPGAGSGESKRPTALGDSEGVCETGLTPSEAFAGSGFGATLVVGVLLLERAYACAAFAATSISAFARSRVFLSWRCVETKPTSVVGRSRSSSSAVPVTVKGVVSARFSPSLSFCGMTFTRIWSSSMWVTVSRRARCAGKAQVL